MYGLIGRVIAAEGKRDELIGILLEGTGGMPGCLSYVVVRDPGDPRAIWIAERFVTEPVGGEGVG